MNLNFSLTSMLNSFYNKFLFFLSRLGSPGYIIAADVIGLNVSRCVWLVIIQRVNSTSAAAYCVLVSHSCVTILLYIPSMRLLSPLNALCVIKHWRLGFFYTIFHCCCWTQGTSVRSRCRHRLKVAQVMIKEWNEWWLSLIGVALSAVTLLGASGLHS